jgi:hypothetical protein
MRYRSTPPSTHALALFTREAERTCAPALRRRRARARADALSTRRRRNAHALPLYAAVKHALARQLITSARRGPGVPCLPAKRNAHALPMFTRRRRNAHAHLVYAAVKARARADALFTRRRRNAPALAFAHACEPPTAERTCVYFQSQLIFRVISSPCTLSIQID